MASFNSPQLPNHIADDVPAIRSLLTSLAKFDPATGNTDIPNGAKRLVETSSGYEFQSYNGTAWVALEKWNIDVQKVDGYSASTGTTASTIPVRDASGKLPGDISGNAATASKAAALSATNPVSMGGTGATTPAGARENLGVPPTDHSSTATTYGAGNATEYGHNKLSDATDSSLGVNDGTAATPKAVNSAYEHASTAIAKAEKAQTTADSALPKTGGTMTGPLLISGTKFIGKPTSDGAMQICGGTYLTDGAYLQLNGSTRSLGPGAWSLITVKDGNNYALNCSSEGVLKFKDYSVLTSAGGELGGNFRKNGIFIAAVNTNSYVRVCGGINETNGGTITAYGMNHEAFPGAVALMDNSDSPAQLLLFNGSVSHGGKSLVKSVNGVMADEAGNVTLGKGVHLVDSWKDGADWYRVWSDGWLEQGGYQASSRGTMSMHLPFSDKQYFWSAQSELLEAARVGGYEVYGNHLDGQTVDLSYSFSNYAANVDGFYHPFYWYACGYGG